MMRMQEELLIRADESAPLLPRQSRMVELDLTRFGDKVDTHSGPTREPVQFLPVSPRLGKGEPIKTPCGLENASYHAPGIEGTFSVESGCVIDENG